MTPTVFSVDTRTLLRVAMIVLGVWVLYLVRDIVGILLVAIVITAALQPLITRLEGPRTPRAVAVIGTYFAFFLIVAVLLALILPVLGHQMAELVTLSGRIIAQLQSTTLGALLGLDALLTPQDATGSPLAPASVGGLLAGTASVVTNAIGALAAVSMSFYMSLRRDGIKRFLLSLTPAVHKPYVASLTDRIQDSFGRWMAGQLVVMLFVGSLYTIALWALGVPYALVLGTFGGVMEIIPYLGPIVSAVPAILIATTVVSPMAGLAVAGAYWLINLTENHILIPQIMRKTTGLDPVVIILALLVGAKVAGLVGIILAVPLATALSVFLRDVMDRRIDA